MELCLGGIFQLARRDSTAATVTIVSLDDEPAFEGARLTALLTNDSDLAQRVRQLCLGGAGSDEAILDAAPRGLAEDEPALKSLLEKVINREEAAFAEARRSPSPPAAKRLNLTWKRIFHSEPEERTPGPPEKPSPLPAPPRGQNPWLARYEAAEREHGKALDLANAALESARAQSVEQAARAQAVAEEWKGRFEEADARAGSLADELAGALAETRRLMEAHERERAVERERASRLLAEGEASRRALSERVTALEASATRSESQAAALEKEKKSLLEAARLARDRHEALTQKLKQAQETAKADGVRLQKAHAQALAAREARIRVLETDRDQAETLRKAAVAERDREATKLAAVVEAAEKQRLEAVSAARNLEAGLAESRARIEELEARSAGLLAQNAATAAERDAAVALREEAEEAHREALRLAIERAGAAEREFVLEIARLNAAVADWQARFETAAEASRREAGDKEAQHAATVAGLEARISQLRTEADGIDKNHRVEMASLAERLSLSEREKAALLAERDEALVRAGQEAERSREAQRLAEERAQAVQSENAAALSAALSAAALEGQARVEAVEAQLSALETGMANLSRDREVLTARLREAEKGRRDEKKRFEKEATSWQTRLDTAARAATKGLQRVEARHAAQVARLQEKVAGLNKESHAAGKETASLSRKLAAAEREKDILSKARDEAEVRLKESGERHQEALRLAEERAAGLKREVREEAARASAAIAEWQGRLELAKTDAAAEAQRISGLHAVLVTRLENDIEQLRRRSEAEAQARQNDASLHQERVIDLERERAAALARFQEIQTRSSQQEQEHLEALRLSEQRVSALQLEKVQEAARLAATIAELQLRLDAAARAHAEESEASQALRDRLEGVKAQEEKHREAARLADQRYAALQQEKIEEGARLAAVAAEWQSRFEAAAQISAAEAERIEAGNALVTSRLTDEVEHLRRQAEAAAALSDQQAAAVAQRLSELQRENTALRDERTEIQARWRKAQENLAALQSRLEAESAAHRKDGEAWEERLSSMERDRSAARAERDALAARLREQEERQGATLRAAGEGASSALREKAEETARLEAMVAQWQSRFEGAAKEAANEARRREAGHAAAMGKLRAEAEQLRKDGRAAAEARKEEARGFAERLSALEGEKAKALQEIGALQRRLGEMETSHRDALRLLEERSEGERREHIERLAKASADLVEAESRLDVAAKAAAKEVRRLEAKRAAEVRQLQAELTHAYSSSLGRKPLPGLLPWPAEAVETHAVGDPPSDDDPGAPSPSPTWEYERILQGSEKKPTKMQAWLESVTRRIRGGDGDSEADG